MHQSSNKDNAVQFITLIASGQIDQAYDQFASPTGNHHSLHFAAGFDALRNAMKENYKRFPDKRSTIQHVVAEDGMVAIHSHVTLKPGDSAFAIVHLLRFENEKIVELWDFTQSTLI